MRAYLTIEDGSGPPRVHELFPDQPITLGRSRGSIIRLPDEHASRLHARIYWENGHWVIEDSGTTNGTRLNGEPVVKATTLAHGNRIGIGDLEMLFTLAGVNSGDLDSFTEPNYPPLPAAEEEPSPDPGRTTLRADEMTAIYGFIAAAMGESDPHATIRRALTTVLAQTGASIAGFLSLDKNDPLPKIVYPESARVDFHLSQRLTEKARSGGRSVWLSKMGDGDLHGDSLLPFQDALCLPLLAEGVPLGAMHVYRTTRSFSERDLRFCEIVAGFVANILGRIRVRRALEAENSRLRSHAPLSENLIGESPPLKNLRQKIARASTGHSTVLIQGETGSGKELVAQDLHRQSPRRHGPLVVLNCASLPAQLLEGELFGHVKGAFTGATGDRTGLFEQADEGTLFLDEIGEMSLDCQAKLLRVIEGKGFRPVGGSVEIQPDVRIVAATHRDLNALVKEGKFRQDLIFRLCIICIQVPPLREHAEDIPALVEYFLNHFANECGRRVRFTPAALECLQRYSWPGNVRQLRSLVESLIMMNESDAIEACDIFLPALPQADHPPSLDLENVEAWAIRKALHETGGNNLQAARILGIARETLASKRKKYGIGKEGEG